MMRERVRPPHWLGSRPPANPQQAVVGGKEVVSWLPRLLQGGASPHWLGSQPPAHLELAGGCRAAGAHRAAQTDCRLSRLLWQSSAWAAAMGWPSWAVALMRGGLLLNQVSAWGMRSRTIQAIRAEGVQLPRRLGKAGAKTAACSGTEARGRTLAEGRGSTSACWPADPALPRGSSHSNHHQHHHHHQPPICRFELSPPEPLRP